MRRKKNGVFNVGNLWRVFFVMSPDVQPTKSAVLLVTLNFEWQLMYNSNWHFKSDFAHSFDFRCHTNFAKVSIFCSRFCFNLKFKVTCENEYYECRCIQTHFKEKIVKFVLFQSPFFSHQNSIIVLPSWVVWSLSFYNNNQTRFNMVHSTPNEHVSYTQPSGYP